MNYRQLAAMAVDAEGVWLQAVLMFALNERIIDLNRYVDAIIGLASRNHGHLSISGDVLLRTFELGTTPELYRLRPVCHFIGGKNADAQSHINVAEQFLLSLWMPAANVRPYNHQMATSILLRALLMRRPRSEWAYWAARLLLRLPPDLKIFIYEWAGGHFFPADELFRVEKVLRTRLGELLLRKRIL